MTAPRRHAVLLLSGGPDSAAVLAWLLHRRWEVSPLFVDYGQRTAPAEERAAVALRDDSALRTHSAVRPLARLDVADLRALCGFGLQVGLPTSGGASEAPDGAEFVPQRNLLLATLGSMYAASVGAGAVALGLVGSTSVSYPDTSRAYAGQLEALLRATQSIDVLSPFADQQKSDAVIYGLSRGVRYDLTWSCAQRTDVHCGDCPSCRARLESFRPFHEIPATPVAEERAVLDLRS